MSRPTKSIELIKGHLSNAEKERRKEAESSLLTGRPMHEEESTKADPVAHSEFLRLKRLFQAIDKDDDLVGGEINTYCICKAEIHMLREQLGSCSDAKLRDKIDKMIMRIRRFMFDIEKENLMTVNSALRAIPKKSPIKAVSKMAEMIERRGRNNDN